MQNASSIFSLPAHAAILPLALLVGCSSVGSDADDADGEGASDEGALTIDGFEEPTDEQASAALQQHANVDPEGVVPRDLLGRALAFYDLNAERIDNKRVVSVIDFSRHSGKKRLFLIDMRSGSVDAHVVAHGSGSDPGHTGYVQRFSNTSGSNASSNGYYLTAETYNGNNGRSLRLDGVSSTNSRARARAVVMHAASYVEEGRSKQGRSWGCPAVTHEARDEIIDRIRGGSVLYAEKAQR
jgi:hypothetical protein